jgi:flagellin
MNRLVHAGDNAANVSMNLSESNSRIMDTDYAQATAQMARSLILNEAGSAMLSQANQQPYYVLALLS